MRRMLFVLLTVVLLGGLVACSSDDDPAPSEASSDEASEASEADEETFAETFAETAETTSTTTGGFEVAAEDEALCALMEEHPEVVVDLTAALPREEDVAALAEMVEVAPPDVLDQLVLIEGTLAPWVEAMSSLDLEQMQQATDGLLANEFITALADVSLFAQLHCDLGAGAIPSPEGGPGKPGVPSA